MYAWKLATNSFGVMQICESLIHHPQMYNNNKGVYT